MRNFTKYSQLFLFGLFLVGFFAVTNPLHAQQSHTITVNSPASVAGDYQALLATFGCDVDSVSGELVVVDDGMGSTTGCTAITTDLTGKIAFIDRGGCEFSLKVYNAQQRGAIAVVVANVEEGTDYIAMGPGENSDLVTIPSYFVVKGDGDIIRSGFAEGVNITIRPNPDGVEIIYEEDFENGLDGWTQTVTNCNGFSTAGVELWTWEDDNFIESPCFVEGGLSPGFPSQCNGFVSFKSDLADSGEDGCSAATFGTGPCPSPHTGILTSPRFDLTTSTAAGYSVRFRQLTLNFLSEYYVGWSYDGGVTWDSVAINTDIPPNEYNPVEDGLISVPLPGSIDASSVTVRFTYIADYYFWAIDQVQIIAQEANNLQVNENFFAVSPNFLTPASQVEPFGLLADIENVGSAAQDNVNLNFTMVDSTFSIIYTADLSYGTVASNTIIENIPFEDNYTPTEVGGYIGLYEISGSLGDIDEGNNIQGFNMFITEDLFSKEIGATRPFGPDPSEWDEGEVHSWAYGNHYHVPNGDGYFVKDVSFALGDPANERGRSFLIQLYEWTNDANNDGNMDPNERVPQAFSFYTISGEELPGQTITVPFPGEGADPVALKDDTDYVLMLEYYAGTEDDITFAGSEARDYGAQIFVSQIQGAPRYASLLGINGDLTTEPYSTVGFGRFRVPVCRMSITSAATNTKDLANIENEFSVYPNPATESVNLQLALQEQANNVVIRLMDIAGSTILQRDYQNIQKEIISYNVANLPSGTYFIQVTTAEGTGTKKFVVSE